MICPQCRKVFPNELIQPLVVTTFGRKEESKACPICALRLLNAEEFVNPEARLMHKLAKRHLKETGQ